MVSGVAAVAAVASALAVASAAVARPGSFDYYYPESAVERAYKPYPEKKKLCYEDGDRAVGAPGYPYVDYMPCCSGKPPLPMDPKMKSYSEKKHYGLWCGGNGKVVVPKKGHCYAAGKRAIGAPGKPAVPYMPCCDGREPQNMYGDWGKFCGYAAPKAPKPEVPEKSIPKKCAGDDGYPYVEHVDCGEGYKCEREPKYGWGFFCVPVGKSCYGPGVKGQGANGYPAIQYMPCCDGQAMETKYGEWGKFCPGKKAPMYEAPKPDYYKPIAAPKDYKPDPAPKGYEPPSYPTYPTYPKKMDAGAGAGAGAGADDTPLTEEFGDDFGCSSDGDEAVPTGDEPDDWVASTNHEVTLPACDNGGLTQEQAEALLQRLCDLAIAFSQRSDPAAEPPVCVIESVPATSRMVQMDDGMDGVVRQQGGFVRIVIYWFIVGPFNGFFTMIGIIFGTFVSAAVGPSQTPMA